MSSTQEADVLFKRYCEKIDTEFGGGGVNAYCSVISARIPEMLREKVVAESIP